MRTPPISIWLLSLLAMAGATALAFGWVGGAGAKLVSPKLLAARSDSPASNSAAAPTDALVSIVDFAYQPAQITVTPGMTVTWTYNGFAPHSTTSGFCTGTTCTQTPGWDSGILTTSGQQFPHMFLKPGVYTYFCRVHLSAMQGKVLVLGPLYLPVLFKTY